MHNSAEPRKALLVSDIRSFELYMPLSILSIATVAKQKGFATTVIDGQVDEDVLGKVRAGLQQATILGVSSHTGPSIATVLKVLELARTEFPHVPTVWGGYHATQAYRSILQEGHAAIVVKGSGERAFAKILDEVPAASLGALKARLRHVPNISMLDEDGSLVDNPIVPLDIKTLAPMDYSLLDVPRYLQIKPTIQFITSYGCPYACTFCAEPSQSLRRWNGLDVERICDELSHLWTTYKPRRISLIDPNFSTSPSRVVELVHEMRRRGLYIRLSATMRGRDVTMIAKKIDLKELAAIGFSTIFIGIESGSDRMLKQLKKAATAADMLRACQLADAAGIHVKSSFMHDLPGETEEDSELTFRLIEEICPLNNRQSHHFYMPYPSTELYDSLPDSRLLYGEATQDEWATASTFGGTDVWPGRPEFRRRVLARLQELHARYPRSIPKLVVERLRA